MRPLLFILLALHASAASYVEFYVQPTGSNLNAGSTSSDAATVTSTNGDWGNAAANRFTAASGTPFSGVTAGEYASIYLDGATVSAYVAKITAVNGGGASIDLSTTENCGTAPATGATGRSCKVGGAWAGPSGAVAFPFGFAEADLSDQVTDPHADAVRINLKGDGDNSTADYTISAAMAHEADGPIIFSGYTTTPGDGGLVRISGGTSGTYYTLLTVTQEGASGASTLGLHNIIWSDNGGSGSAAAGVYINTGQTHIYRNVFASMGGAGIRYQGVGSLVACEAYGNNEANSVLHGGIQLYNRGVNAFYCISHDNAGSNTDGFTMTNGTNAFHCISDSNGRYGFSVRGVSSGSIVNCDAYNNGSSGINMDASLKGAFLIENTNLVKNGGWGINYNSSNIVGVIANCGFGAGTQANTSGTITGTKGVPIIGTVTYANDVTPWTDPANGDFRISLAAAQDAGRGVFVGTVANATPDIGAAFALDDAPPEPPGDSTINATTTNATTVTIQ